MAGMQPVLSLEDVTVVRADVTVLDAPHLRKSLRTALIPAIDGTKVVGLISLPGGRLAVRVLFDDAHRLRA